MVDEIATIRYGSGIPFDFFVFTSFCLLAAVFSRTFAETVAKRLAAEVEKAKRESEEAQTLATQGAVARNNGVQQRELPQENHKGLPAGVAVPPSCFMTLPPCHHRFQ